jgi:hypothetical protein
MSLPTEDELVNAIFDVKRRIDVITESLKAKPDLLCGMYKFKVRVIRFVIAHLLKLLSNHKCFCLRAGQPDPPYWSCC